ncbi:ABC transporter substrate-binding protein [Anaeromyxobacter dehalogenans]|uniref:Amino acid/amide ABC transporter substrate-binding protein, HAAT family n=1 Tax=Anaeromyxobacter dehalogenans (strain 2CP-C) TaxID=290397 RepID=Q2IJS3_ANADE|nr:ABC transporter substrate-binding protein [Anaeromyxobacter dehalogenans]ABC81907.1 amino acid/amide ABC transporter substrate-binding protein, HAAT family [Anaeromyxobacter dehalogenans 2CP-C]
MHRFALALVAAGLAAGAAPAPAAEKLSDGKVKLGVLTDMTGYYADLAGPGSVVAARMAVEDFGGKVLGKPVELVSADHQLKADVASNIARKWIDEGQVDAIVDLVSSSTAGAVMPVAAEKKRITLLSGPGTTAFTGEKCTRYNVHYTYNNWALANGTGREVVKQGGDSWFFLTADYIFGKSLEEDTTKVVKAAGGKVLGAARYPSPGTTDFSSYLLQAQGSGAKIVGLANAGADTVNSIRQAEEFGVTPKQSLAGLLVFITDVHSLGLEAAKGMYLTTAFYWDLNDETRKWSRRFFQKHGKMPTMVQAGVYSSVMHYLKAVQAAGTDDADAVMAKMRETPVNDFFAKNARIGPDGLLRHDMYLARVKAPKDSKQPWDYYQIVKTIPAAEAFPSVEAQACPLAKR